MAAYHVWLQKDFRKDCMRSTPSAGGLSLLLARFPLINHNRFWIVVKCKNPTLAFLFFTTNFYMHKSKHNMKEKMTEMKKAWSEYKKFLQEKYPVKEGEEWEFTCPHHQKIDTLIEQLYAKERSEKLPKVGVDDKRMKCNLCEGRGILYDGMKWDIGDIEEVTCDKCNGKGYII